MTSNFGYFEIKPLAPRTLNCWNLTPVFILLVGFVALRPKSRAMVIAGRSVHLITLFPGQA